LTFVLSFGVTTRVVLNEKPPIAIRLAAPDSEFDGKMAAFNQSPNDFLDAILGRATRRGETSDAGPGVALPFVDEICDHIGEHEGEWRQLRIGSHLVEPNEFFARKGHGTAIWRVDDVMAIDAIVRRRIKTSGRTPP